MEFFSCSSQEQHRKTIDLIILPFWEEANKAEKASKLFKTDFSDSIAMKDFNGREGELLFLYGSKELPDKRIALLGLGKKEKLTVEKLRRAYSQVAKACHQKKIHEICLFLPQSILDEKAVVTGVAEGMLLANYVFNKLKSKSEENNLIKRVGIIGVSKQGINIAKRCGIIAEGIYLARDLVNGNADDINPEYLVQMSKNLSRKLPLKATILGKREIEKEKMGLLLAVNRGSAQDPALIVLSYRGRPGSKHHTVIVGKGITYDTGGLNLKPVASMETMKADMAGGAAALGTIYAAASLRLKVNVSVVIPVTENSIDSKSFKPGDVYKSSKGLTIEVVNPDAEGRLVLADAITYAKKKLAPTCLIDIATLTGGIDIALGNEACGLFSNDEALSQALVRSSQNTFERVWRLPIYEEYREVLKSDIADMKNSAGRSASSILAAKFLQEFVEDTPWAHLDIASVAYLNEKKRYQPKYGTGFGVRLLIDLLMNE